MEPVIHHWPDIPLRWPMNMRELLEAIQEHHRAMADAHTRLSDAQLDLDFHLAVIQEYERELISAAAKRAVG